MLTHRLSCLVASVLLAASIACLLTGCASVPTTAGLPPASRTRELVGCTPLLLTVMAGDDHGAGSGVLVHPRVILTAGHVVPEGAGAVLAFVDLDGGGEMVGVDQIVRGSRQGWWGDDWALLVLSEPFRVLPAVPASRLGDGAEPPLGDPLIMAGFPGLKPGEARGMPYQHEAVLIRTGAVKRPAWAAEDPAVWFASDLEEWRPLTGMSGGPVFLNCRGGPLLVGLFVGEASKQLAGVRYDRALVIAPLPRAAIEAAVVSVGG